MRTPLPHVIVLLSCAATSLAQAAGVSEITFVYQGKTASYAFTTPGAAGAAATAATAAVPAVLPASSVAAIASAAVAASSIPAAETQAVQPVSILSTTVPVSIATVAAPAPATTILTLTSQPDGPVAGNTALNGYASAQSVAAAAAASASANAESASTSQSQGSGGGLSHTAIIGLAAGLGGAALLLLVGIILCCVFCAKRKTKKREASYYVYTAEEEAKDDARRSQMSSRVHTPTNSSRSGTFSKQDMTEPSLPKVSEEPYAADEMASAGGLGAAGAGAYSAYDNRHSGRQQGHAGHPAMAQGAASHGAGSYSTYDMGRASPSSRANGFDDHYSQNAALLGGNAAGRSGARSPARSPARTGSPGNVPTALRPGQGMNGQPGSDARGTFGGRGVNRYDPVSNPGPASNGSPAAAGFDRSAPNQAYRGSTGNPSRGSRGVSPAMIRATSPLASGGNAPQAPTSRLPRTSSYDNYAPPQQQQQQQQQQYSRPSPSGHPAMSGFDFGLNNQNRSSSPNSRPQPDRYNGQRQAPNNYR